MSANGEIIPNLISNTPLYKNVLRVQSSDSSKNKQDYTRIYTDGSLD